MTNNTTKLSALIEIFLVSFRLGCTSFGGPIAHLGYFQEAYVRNKRWLNEQAYANLVALSQFLPGPASSQVGIGIGIVRGGLIGGIISFLGFTLPSVLALILFALFIGQTNLTDAGWIQGLKLVAVAVVAHAVIGMSQKLTTNLPTKALALGALVLTILWPHQLSQLLAILLAAAAGYLFMHPNATSKESANVNIAIKRRTGVICLSLFFLLLAGLPLLRTLIDNPVLAMADSFYRAGSLVFGGGHVVLPLLEREFVPTGLISQQDFLTGYGAAQAVPGPLFTFAAYLGTVLYGWQGGLLATAAIFLPAFLLLIGALPFWTVLQKNASFRKAFAGINAAVVGILISAFFIPIWSSAIQSPLDIALAAVFYSLLAFWKLPAWFIVILGALSGFIL
ncbi:chromate transporter [Terribacillus aidingensis]|uniref:Chromate transporter n=1 Tax=Terribacillus aidingensis TaxID=586416 RepID=A0A285P6H5_9BACI|nr:chromate efflux transporter [Terribacillus aidingensis]SNZ17334.1 chromate transporter [Terribacillus aidingensis]